MIDFPDTPTPGQEFTVGGLTWVFNDPLWNLKSSGSGGGSSGGGSDGFSFTQDAAPTATTAGQTWFDTATGNSFVWFDGQWSQFAPGSGGDSKLLSVTSERVENLATFMDAQSDISLDDPATYPFDTIAEIEISALYMKPDRQFRLGANLWTKNFHALDNPANNATIMAIGVESNGANFTLIGALHGSIPVAAGAVAGWVLRLTGVTGGATGFGYSFIVTKRRYRA